MAKHRKFNADRFLDKFRGYENLLREYAALWGDGLAAESAWRDVDGFKEFLAEAGGSSIDELTEGMSRVFDLCTEDGHEVLKSACKAYGYDPDPKETMPVEHFSLVVRTHREGVFNFAYDCRSLQQAERFSIYRGEKPQTISDIARVASDLENALKEQFKSDKHSNRIQLRHFQEDGRVNFIVYHEKRTHAVLTFKGQSGQTRITPTVFRPAQQDYICYETGTGQLEIEARIESEETALRKNFATCCFGDSEFFDGPEAADLLDLQRIVEDGFAAATDEGDRADLVEIYFTTRQKNAPTFQVRSADVLETLSRYRLRRSAAGGSVKRAAFKFTFPDDRRGKRVVLSGANKMSFKRYTHARDVMRYLRRWGILRG